MQLRKLSALIVVCLALGACGHKEMTSLPWSEELKQRGEAYAREVDHMLEVVDAWAAETDMKTREAMTSAFLISLQYEYEFWDYGYNGSGN